PENDLIPVDRLDIEGLVIRAGVHFAQPIGDDDEVSLEDFHLLVFAACKGAVNGSDKIRTRQLAEPDMVLELLQQQRECPLQGIVQCVQKDFVPAGENPNAQELLYHLEVAVVRPANLGQDGLVAYDDCQWILHSAPSSHRSRKVEGSSMLGHSRRGWRPRSGSGPSQEGS